MGDLKARSDDLLSRPWRDVEVPEAVRAVPTMLSPQEQALLFTLARDYVTGDGAIVDAGCFLGGSSAALLAGLAERGDGWAGPPVISYDRFLVEPYTLEAYFADVPGLRLGDTFRPMYDANVAGFDAPHDVREGDLTEIGWPGGPIEVLFVDVLKTWELNQVVLRDFMPHVIPGRTVIVHQDYGWGQLHWIHITVELMRDSLRWLDAVPWCSHVFLVERPIPPDLLAMDVRRDVSDEDKVRLMDRAVERESGATRDMLSLAKAGLLQELGREAQAGDIVREVARRTDDDSVRMCIDMAYGALVTDR